MPLQIPSDLTHIRFEGAVPAAGAPLRADLPQPPPPAHRVPASPRTCRFAAALLQRAGIDPTLYRPRTLERRIPACLRALKAPTEDAAAELLDARPELLRVAIDALLIGVTEFFRDPAVFADVRDTVLPCLQDHERLRVWSAGSSSGAELYSVAMLLADAGLLDRADLLGSDCRPHAIADARAAVFAQPMLEGMSAELRDRYFEPAPPAWRVVARLRDAARWRVADFTAGAEDGEWDVILWRNASIYLDADCAQRVALDLLGTLRPGGFLVLGKAERPPEIARMTRVGHCLYRKDGLRT